MHRCKDCGGEVVPYSHPVAPEAHPPFVCSNCGRFYMRSEVADLPTDAGPQEGVHSPVEPSWHQWEPGHEGKAMVTDKGHVYSWSNGTWDSANPAKRLTNPNGGYMPHTQFMRERLNMSKDEIDKALSDWHYFEVDPDGTVFPDSPTAAPGYSDALQDLQTHHPALDVSEAGNKWTFS